MHPEYYNILIVDDNAAFARSFSNLIHGTLGFGVDTVFTVGDISGARILMKDHRFDYVFISVKMHENTAVLVSMIHNLAYMYPDQKIVIVSFHNEPAFRDQMTLGGALTCILKDEIDVDQLLELFTISKLENREVLK